MRNDEYWIERCISLARKGRGATSPNPLVGAVIVKEGIILGEGYHGQFGGPHAEINAIEQSLRSHFDVQGATLYVNLEPCFHFGNTPPCVDEIIRQRIARVVISSLDPNPLVSGKSIRKLRRIGIQCTVGIKRREAEHLNEKFFKYVATDVPFVSLKAAQTLDGFIARSNGTSRWISNSGSRKYVHELRGEYDAVLIGAGTVIADDPLLTVRSAHGRNPLRIVLDGRLRIPVTSKVLNRDAPTVVYTSHAGSTKKIQFLEKNNIAVVRFSAKNGRIPIHAVLEDLAHHQISSLLVEGGQEIYSQFLNAGVVDKMYLFTAPKIFRTGIPAFSGIKRQMSFKRRSGVKIGSDILEELYVS